MSNSTIQGIVELRPSIFDECPHYATFGLRAASGKFYEVFLPAAAISKEPARFRIGRRLTLRGGEFQTESTIDGVGEYVRWWPAEIQAEVSPRRKI